MCVLNTDPFIIGDRCDSRNNNCQRVIPSSFCGVSGTCVCPFDKFPDNNNTECTFCKYLCLNPHLSHMTGYTLDTTVSAWPPQMKFTLPCHIFS